MRLFTLGALLSALVLLVDAQEVIKPKVVVLSTFVTEQDAWRGAQGFNTFASNVTIGGMMGESVHCSVDGGVCQAVVGEGEINAALSTSSLVASDKFDFTDSYILIAGTASINPKVGTLGSVTFARYAVQFGLQHELSSSSSSSVPTSSYIPLGSNTTTAYPSFILGTEVFELNDNLRNTIAEYAHRAFLVETDESIVYRSHYQTRTNIYSPGCQPPTILLCDSVTSDTWYSGSGLGEQIEKYTKLITNGTGVYCTASQEDNAILTALLRAAVAKKVDFKRIVLMRVGSDFDREYWGQDPAENLFQESRGAGAALVNLGRVGGMVVRGVLEDWDDRFEGGVREGNYVGDVWGSLGGVPDFGTGREELGGRVGLV